MSNSTSPVNANRAAFKTATPPVLLAAIVAIEKFGPATAKEIGISPANANRLMKLGLVEVEITINTTSGAGRPANVYALTAIGRKRARRAVARFEA